jgi:hypothetical protein
MKKLTENNFKFFILFLLCFAISKAHCIDPAISAKYPFVLLNDDHGILMEAELADETYGLTTDPIRSTHWKCYHTDTININYRVLQYSKEWGEHVASFNIYLIDENGIVNQYGMRHAMGVTYCKETSEIWKKLLRNQEYVCINGSYASNEDKLYHGKKQRVFGWVFNKLKTINGCYNYFGDRDCTGKFIAQDTVIN